MSRCLVIVLTWGLLGAAPARAGEGILGVPLAGAPPAAYTGTPDETPADQRLVLAVSIDGLRPDGWTAADAPNLDALAAAGSCTLAAHTAELPKTLPGHASMITGVQPSRHGLEWNRYRFWEGPIQYPTVFRWVRAAGLDTTMVASKRKFKHFDVPGDVLAFRFVYDVSVPDELEDVGHLYSWKGNSRKVVDKVVDYLREGRRGLVFVHLPEVDDLGHKEGWMSPHYLEAVAEVDLHLGRLRAFLEEEGLLEETSWILTADHGGSGHDHGPDIPHSDRVPFIMSGRGVKPGATLGDDVSILDLAPTAAAFLGVPATQGLDGRVVAEALTFEPPEPVAAVPPPAGDGGLKAKIKQYLPW